MSSIDNARRRIYMHAQNRRYNIDLAMKISKRIHDECENVPHDIGLKVLDVIENDSFEHNSKILDICSRVFATAQYDSAINQVVVKSMTAWLAFENMLKYFGKNEVDS